MARLRPLLLLAAVTGALAAIRSRRKDSGTPPTSGPPAAEGAEQHGVHVVDEGGGRASVDPDGVWADDGGATVGTDLRSGR